MNTENLSTLKIHKLTQAQYERELEAGRVDPSALYLTPDEGVNFVSVYLDFWDYTSSHSASEIIEAARYGKRIIVNNSFDFRFINDTGDSFGPVAYIVSEHVYPNGVAEFGDIYIKEDKSFEELWYYDKRIATVVTVDGDNVASHNSFDISYVICDGGIVNLSYNGLIYNYSHELYNEDTDMLHSYFINNSSDGNVKLISVVTIDNDANVSVVNELFQPIVPAPEESDVGKVLVAGNGGHVSWENASLDSTSGKTLTEHLTEEDMVLSSRQYGDKLPGEDGEPYTHVPGRIFFLKVGE